jgi:hypothetical protein
MQTAGQRSRQEFDWEEVKRVKRPARFAGDETGVFILLRGKKRRLQKIVLVPDHLSADDETAAILDRIVQNRFVGEW